MGESPLDLLQRYGPQLLAEYRRIGIANEMDRYFAGSGGDELTSASFERELQTFRTIPSGIGFDSYCALVSLDPNAIKQLTEEAATLRPPDKEL